MAAISIATACPATRRRAQRRLHRPEPSEIRGGFGDRRLHSRGSPLLAAAKVFPTCEAMVREVLERDILGSRFL